MKQQWADAAERFGAISHALHGSRGLMLGAGGLLVLALVEPAIPVGVNHLWLTLPVFAVLVNGLVTLPREGVAAQLRAVALLEEDDPVPRMARRIIWPIALAVLLAPRFFLAGYGIPHLNPLAGVLLPAAQRQITLTFLFALMLLPALYLRSSKRYAPHIVAKRPVDLPEEDHAHRERDIMLMASLVVFIAWAWLLHGFWTPFSLLQWPPSFDSLRLGARGVASMSFAVAIPLVLWMNFVAHVRLIRVAWPSHHPSRIPIIAWALGHLALITAILVLHAYDLLWIVQYRSAVPF